MNTSTQHKRPWTMKEVLWLKENYRQLGPERCAEFLKRTPGAVVLQAMAHGAGKPKVKRAEIEPRIRELHARGLSDEKIAGELGWTTSGRERVKYWRNLIGLPVNPQDCHADGARGAKAACANNGVKTFVELRHEKARVDAAMQGWCGANNQAQVSILEILRECGELTIRQIMEKQGRVFRKGSGAYGRMWLHLRHLVNVGLVVFERGSQVRYRLAYQPSSENGEDD